MATSPQAVVRAGSVAIPGFLLSHNFFKRLRRIAVDGRYWFFLCAALIFLRFRLRHKRRRLQQESESSLSPSDFLLRVGPRHLGSKLAGKNIPPQFGLDDDRFELVNWIADGGFANVYMCTRMKTGDEYAAKIIDTSSFDGNSQKITNLQREIRVMRELHHPRIVNLHECFWVKHGCIIVMDLASGGDLLHKLGADVDRGHCPFKGLGGGEIACKHVACQLISGINYMHDYNVIHRDLKLENILITSSNTSTSAEFEFHDVKIADFGLSKFQDDVVRRKNTAVGTPSYVAPEVLESDNAYDERVDLWSYGVIMYCMLCGCMPFKVTVPIRLDRHREEVSKVRNCDSWRCLSSEGKGFVSGLLTVDPDARLARCLEHPWLASPLSRAQTLDAFSTNTVKKIVGRTSGGVHSIEIYLQDGSKTFHGTAGGRKQQTYKLEPGEVVIAVMQEISHSYKLGSAVVFYTTSGRILKVEGSMARTRNRFVAPLASQIVALQFDGSRLAGVYLKEVDANCEGAVEQIVGSVGSAVDYCKFQLRGGKSHQYGNPTGSTVVGPWQLQPLEFITIVEQFFRDRDLGASLAFYTSAGRVFKLVGMVATSSPRFAAPWGQQICGITFTDDGRLSDVLCIAIGEHKVPEA